MKPRQSLKNINSTSLSQSCLPPPPPPPPLPASLLQNQQPPRHQPQQQRNLSNLLGPTSTPSPSSSSTSTTATPSPATLSRDVELAAKFGLNLVDLASLQTNLPSISTQDDLIKCLQAIYGKSGAELLQKLPPSNDWPSQSQSSISPPALPAKVGSNSLSNSLLGPSPNSMNANLSSSIGDNNNICNNNNSGNDFNLNVSKLERSQKAAKDMQSASSFTTNSSNLPTASSVLNQSFRNTTLSSQLQQHQHQRSVLSLHHHQQQQQRQLQQVQQQQQQQQHHHHHHHHHQNDHHGNRKMSQHSVHHHVNTSSANASSFGNINETNVVAAAAAVASPTDTNDLASALSGKNSSSVSTTTATTPNIIDQFNSMDNSMFYDRHSSQINNNNNNNLNRDTSSMNNQQSLIKHQQLQKLLKATNNNINSNSGALQHNPKQTQAGTLTHNLNRNDFHQSSHPGRSGNLIDNSSGSNNMPPQVQKQLSSSTPSILSNQPNNYPPVPKSLLNLAACSSSAPILSSRLSSINQLNLLSGRQSSNGNNSNRSNSSNNNKTTNPKNHPSNNNNISSSFSNDLSLLHRHNEPTNVSQPQIMSNISTTATPATSSASQHHGPSAKSSLKQHLQFSLLSDSQIIPSTNRGDQRNVEVTANYSDSSSQNQAQSHRLNLLGGVNNISLDIGTLTKIHDRMNKQSGGAHGMEVDISKSSSQPSSLLNASGIDPSICQAFMQPHSSISISPSLNKDTQYASNNSNQTYDRREIESALSRVEARNDISLLYPPILLASNSQKQLNALSARLQNDDGETEAFTKEIKKIVLEECNIIYECKECSSLFRSLANLVQHKRTYCVEQSSARSSLEVNKRSTTNPLVAFDPSTALQPNDDSTCHLDQRIDIESSNTVASFFGLGSRQVNDEVAGNSRDCSIRCKKNTKVGNDLKMLRTMSDREKRQKESLLSQQSSNNAAKSQTSLSKLLQSQPKSRLPTTRDNTLMGAISMGPTNGADMDNDDQTSGFSGNSVINSPLSDFHDQIIRNSSLAKTLLSEKIRSNNSPRQSLIELSRAESSFQQIQKGQNFTLPNLSQKSSSTPGVGKPKRKFLEDCIQRVKREKSMNADETQDPGSRPSESYPSHIDMVSDNNMESRLADKGVSTNRTDESSLLGSDADSDALMIDTGESDNRRSVAKESDRPDSARALSTASSSSSSALLRALTRPSSIEGESASLPDAGQVDNDNNKNHTGEDEDVEVNKRSTDDSHGDGTVNNNDDENDNYNDEEAGADADDNVNDNDADVGDTVNNNDDNNCDEDDASDASDASESSDVSSTDFSGSSTDSSSSNASSDCSNDSTDDDDDEEDEDDEVGDDDRVAKDNEEEVINDSKESKEHHEKHENSSTNASKLSSDASGSSGSGGIMKLKIQLKAQPDEKSKVYRIV